MSNWRFIQALILLSITVLLLATQFQIRNLRHAVALQSEAIVSQQKAVDELIEMSIAQQEFNIAVGQMAERMEGR